MSRLFNHIHLKRFRFHPSIHYTKTRNIIFSKYLINITNNDDDDNDNDNEQKDNSEKVLITDIINAYNKEYSDLNENSNILTAAQSIPGFKYLYIIQLKHPSNDNRINIIGVKQESITQQNEIALEIRNLLNNIQPQTLIVQLCKDRYEAHMTNDIFNNNLISMNMSLNSILNTRQHLINTARMALHLINYITMNKQIRMNPYLYALLYANSNQCSFKCNNIILGDLSLSVNNNNDQNNKSIFKYITSTTFSERRKYGSYPGIKEILFGINSASGVYQWINLNKNTIALKEKDLYQFAIDMQQKIKFGKNILETSTKSMAYYAYKYGINDDDDNGNKNDTVVLCNIFTMLSLPLYFGKITDDEMKTLKKISISNSNKISNKLIYKQWIFNYWNAIWWSLCVMHTTFQTGIHNLDYPYLFQFGVVFPVMYPAVYTLIALRARYRVRRLQQIIMKSNQIQQQKETQFGIDIDPQPPQPQPQQQPEPNLKTQ